MRRVNQGIFKAKKVILSKSANFVRGLIHPIAQETSVHPEKIGCDGFGVISMMCLPVRGGIDHDRICEGSPLQSWATSVIVMLLR